MKPKRDLSSVYFRSKNEETGLWEKRVFEDLSNEEQDKYLEGKSDEWLKSLVKHLAHTLTTLGEMFDIKRGSDYEKE